MESRGVGRTPTLIEILKHPVLSPQFHDFLRKRHCWENVSFWEEAEDYRSIEEEAVLKLRARSMWCTYFCKNATMELNVDNNIKKKIENNLKSPNATLFDEAQQAIFQLMDESCYQGFLQDGKKILGLYFQMDSESNAIVSNHSTIITIFTYSTRN